jgi:hypothetical protein
MGEDIRQVGPYAALHKGLQTNKPKILEIDNLMATDKEPLVEQNAAMIIKHGRIKDQSKLHLPRVYHEDSSFAAICHAVRH